MKLLTSAWLLLGIFLFTFFSPFSEQVGAHDGEHEQVVHQDSSSAVIYVFGRDDCGFCKKQFAFLEESQLPFVYLNIITDEKAAALYDQVTAKHSVTKVTPISVIGEKVIVGFNSELTTGVQLRQALEEAANSPIKTIEQHLEFAEVQKVEVGGGCSGLTCDEGNSGAYVFELPFLGVVDLRSFSLFTLSLLLGVIDGFNPCAMWVLITFLVLLSQAGSKKKMIFLAGIFILAEGLMYNLILNVWYKTWDFVALDQIVTPLVGFLALGGGSFFLWRWNKNKGANLVCDITDLDTQSKTINRFKEIIEKPVTIATIFAILVVALSVNIIEFACSIGIPQAYTKILEMNGLLFLERQWYIMVYTLGYMFDDVIVFGLAIWGYSKLESHGGKYAQMSLLVGGILMLLLGSLLIINPSLLVL
jgi:glutaredoxin/uncharacterized protein (UPF0333 family)